MAPKKIALLTDSCADLDPVLAEENHIYVLPLLIQCADGTYRDGVDIHAADVYRRLRAGETPKTSLPSGASVEETFARIRADGYDAVIAILLSGGLSGTYHMVCLHAEEAEGLKTAVFDSGSGSLGIGMTLLQLAEDIRAGMEWKELIKKQIPKLIAGTWPYFSVDTLDYLRKGGRIGKVTAMAGTMLQIKPILGFAPDGQLTGVAKVRGRKQVQDKLVELAVAACGGHKRYNIAVANGGAEDEMPALKEKLKAALPHYDHVWEGRLDGTLSVYIGDGILGVGIQVLD